MTHPSARDQRSTQLGATLALCLMAICTTFILEQVVKNNRIYGYLFIAIIATQILLWCGRLLKIPTLIASIVTISLSGLIVITALYGTLLGNAHQVSVDFHAALTLFASTSPPFAPLNGLVLMMCGVFILAGVLADWFAFRRSLLFEPMVAYFAIFCFVAVIGTGTSVWFPTAAFMTSALLFSVFQIVNLRVSTVSAEGSIRAKAAYLRIGILLIGAVVISVPLIAPLLPGYGESGLISIDEDSGSEDTNRDIFGTSPTNPEDIAHAVSLKPQLLTQADTEFFKIKSPVRTYWREAVLDNYKNGVFTVQDPRPSHKLNTPVGPLFDATVTVSSLKTLHLPAPFPAVSTTAQQTSINFATGMLVAQQPLSQGDKYNVTAVESNLTADDLRNAQTSVPSAIEKLDLETSTISPQVILLARQITNGIDSNYDKAFALEQYLRNNYQYDLNVDAPNTSDSLEQFLFETKRGYCQQFAGSFAAMARTVGLPARVAIGYTPGELQEDGEYHVLGLHAHAWPEIYLGEFGWVPFEPTPNRGIPNAESYTGAAETQATATTSNSTTTIATTPTTVAPNQQTPTPQDESAGNQQNLLYSVLAIGAVVLISIGFALIRLRKKQTTSTPDQCWKNVEHALAKHKLYRYEGETRIRFSHRAGTKLDDYIYSELIDFASRVDRATFDRNPEDLDLAQDAMNIRSAIVHQKMDKTSNTSN